MRQCRHGKQRKRRCQSINMLHKLSFNRDVHPDAVTRRKSRMGSYRSPVSSRTRKGTAATGRSPGSRVIAFARLPEKGSSPFQWHMEHWLTGHSCGNSAGFEPASLFTPASRGTCNAAWVGAKLRAVNPRLHSQGRALNARRPSPCPSDLYGCEAAVQQSTSLKCGSPLVRTSRHPAPVMKR